MNSYAPARTDSSRDQDDKARVPSPQTHGAPALTSKSAVVHAVLAALASHVAWLVPQLGSFTLLYGYFLVRLSAHASVRMTFRLGFLNGLLVFAPHLSWFWNIFGLPALCLWSVLAAFTGAFVLLLRLFRIHFRSRLVWLAVPILWTGLEYFRSE